MTSLTSCRSKSSSSFTYCFNNNILDLEKGLGYNPQPYGTHSFRRGGCQYLSVSLRWHLRDVCLWGGWSDNFDSPGTIFKYLLSFVDRQVLQRHEFFDPNRTPANRCDTCGRNCCCAAV